MKMTFLVSVLAAALSSSAAFASGEYHHHHHHVVYSRNENVSRKYYGFYQPAPSARPVYTDPFGTYSDLPSPVSDQ